MAAISESVQREMNEMLIIILSTTIVFICKQSVATITSLPTFSLGVFIYYTFDFKIEELIK